jgi:hypothetical protein
MLMWCGVVVACSNNNEGYVVEGRVKMPALAGKGVSKTSNIKVVINGGQKLSFVRSDGSFALYPSATHIYNSSKTVLKRII